MQPWMVTALIIIVFVIFIAFYIRRRNMAFEGVVTDKDVRQEVINDPNSNQSSGIRIGSSPVRQIYTIKIQKSDGKSVSWQVSEGKYQIINIGDKVTKKPGTTDIEVAPKNGPSNQQQPPSQI